MTWCIQVHIMKKVNIFCHSFQKVKPRYYIDSLHIEWNISSFYFLIFWWLWLTDNENPKCSVSERHGHWTSFWYLWQCGQVPSPAGKWNQHLYKACQQKEAWSALTFPGRWLRWLDFRKHSGPTPADDMATQIITDCENFTLDFKQHGFCVSPHFLQTLGPWFPNERQNLLSSEKRTLDHWATVQFFFSLAQVRCFWWCFCFRSGLVALFLKMSERGDSWCWLQLQFTPCEALSSNRLCLTVFSSLRSSLLLVHLFLFNFFLPVNFTSNMLWYSTPWAATSFSNDPLWLTLFVEGVNDRLVDHCQVSSVPHYCGLKEQEIPRIYTVWISFIETQM